MVFRTLLVIAILSISGCSRSRDDSFASTPISRAVVLLSANHLKQALQSCDEVLAAEPNNYRAILLRGEICEALGEPSNAMTEYERAFLIRPLDSEAKYHLIRLRKIVEQSDPRHGEGISEPFVHTPTSEVETDASVASFDSDENAYRQQPSAAPQTQDPSRHAVPSDARVQRLLRALAKGQKKDRQ